MTRRLVMGTTPPPIDPIDWDRRARRRTTDRRRGRLGSRLSRARARSRGIVDRRCVRARWTRMHERMCLSSVFPCNQFVWVNSVTGGDRHHHQPRGASSSAIDADVRRRDARGASSEHARARSFVRSFVRSFENVVDETTEARRETRQPRATTKTNGQSNRSTDGIRRDVDARRVSSSVSRPSTRRRLRRRFRLCSRARGQRARAGR